MSETEKDTTNPQSELTAESKRNREAMREVILKWIGEGVAPKESAASVHKPDDQKPKQAATGATHPGVLSEEQKRAIHEALRRPINQDKQTATGQSEPTAATSVLLSAPQTVLLSSRRRRFNFWAWAYGTLWTGFILGLAVLSIGVYAFHRNDPNTNALLRYVPLPYGFVRYHPIWYGTYRDEFELLNHLRNQQPPASRQSLSPEDIERILVRRTIVNDLAWSYGLWVTNDEVTKEFNDIAAKAGSVEIVSRTVQTLWGINLDEFKQRVLKPYILKKKLLEALSNDVVIKRKISGANDLQALDAYLDQLRNSTSVILFR